MAKVDEAKLAAILKENPGIGPVELGEQLGVTPQTAKSAAMKYIVKGTKHGALVTSVSRAGRIVSDPEIKVQKSGSVSISPKKLDFIGVVVEPGQLITLEKTDTGFAAIIK